jgi:hypothetical protein
MSVGTCARVLMKGVVFVDGDHVVKLLHIDQLFGLNGKG